MKRFILVFALFFAILGVFAVKTPTNSTVFAEKSNPRLVVVIDDFGSWDQSGVDTMLSINAPITCAVMPMVDNSEANSKAAREAGKEVILHMPMEAYVHLPASWYGNIMIGNYDTKEQVYQKLNTAFYSIEGADGFNIHIGSGVCLHEDVMGFIYDWSSEHNLPFLDSRTHINTVCEKVANEKGIVYLGRDEFLEPEGNRSYAGVKSHLMTAANLAKEKGYAIAIGHVGVHGGENTAKAIKDSIDEIKDMGVEIVSLNTLYESLKQTN